MTLSLEGVEEREGVQASHLRMLIDMARLAQSDGLPGLDPRQLAEMAAAGVVVTTDAWLNPATSRPVNSPSSSRPTSRSCSRSPSGVLQ